MRPNPQAQPPAAPLVAAMPPEDEDAAAAGARAVGRGLRPQCAQWAVAAREL